MISVHKMFMISVQFIDDFVLISWYNIYRTREKENPLKDRKDVIVMTNERLESWEVGLNSAFINFYDHLYRPYSEYADCVQCIGRFSGYITALFHTHTISHDEWDLLYVEVDTMFHLAAQLKLQLH